MDLQLSGKVALVTGSDRRTGEVIAQTLAAEGATVVTHGNTERPGGAICVCGDVATEDGCRSVMRTTCGDKASSPVTALRAPCSVAPVPRMWER